MKKLPIISLVLAIFVIVGGVFLFSRGSGKSQEPEVLSAIAPVDGYEYFWGAGCPHCAKVDEFLGSWEGKDKIKLTKKEIYKDLNNRNLLLARAKSCGLDQNQVAVPFLVKPDGSCLPPGDQPIIDHLSSIQLDNP